MRFDFITVIILIFIAHKKLEQTHAPPIMPYLSSMQKLKAYTWPLRALNMIFKHF